MKKILLYGFGGAYNHGGEAIIQTTTAYLRKKYPKAYIYLSTHFKEQDIEFELPVDEYLERDMAYVERDRKSVKKGFYDREIYRSTIEIIDKDTLCFSVGGDNYCYPNWHRWKTIHDAALNVGAEDILWSCSIEPDCLNEELTAHLASFQKITARESITYRALKDKGLTNVSLCRDIAFLLEEKMPKNVTEYLKTGNMIALNVSPMVLRREAVPGMTIKNIRNTIEYLLEHTDDSILLLPHVCMEVDDDREPLGKLYEQYKDTDRFVFPQQQLSAAECKYLIARCKFGIFARTHASIAAYSSGIPCIVLGYSVKAKGIATDEGMADYVLPVQNLCQEDEMVNMVKKLMNEKIG